MQNFNDPTGLMVQALANPQGQQVAGDIVPMRGLDNANTWQHAGPQPAYPYALGQLKDPKIAPIPLDVLKAWMERISASRGGG